MPDWRSTVERRLGSLDIPALRQVDVVEEVCAYLQDRYDEFRSAGHDDAEARRLALAHLDSEALARELARVETHAPADAVPLGSTRSTFMASVWQDFAYALRSMRKAPTFTAVVIVTLALGIGANAAIFSVADAVLLRPYPFPDLDRILMLNERTRSGQTMSVAWPTFQDWRAQNQVFETMGIYRPGVATLTGGDQPERLISALASSDVFRVMGIAPVAGRPLVASDDAPGAPHVAVISERLWRNRFNADPGILGRSILLNNESHAIVGVMPPTMRFPGRATDVWQALGPAVSTFPQSRGTHPNLWVVAKLKPGETFDRAVTDMDTIARRLETEYPESNKDVGVGMIPYYEQVVQFIRPTLRVLLGAVGCVLLIACANLANLTLVRSERRQRDIAVRRAVGADRRRIVQQLLTESLVLAFVGGALGIVLASWIVQVFVASGPTTVPRIDLVGVDRRVVLFATGLTVVTGLLFGLVPALRASNPDVVTALKQNARGSMLAPTVRLRSALVVIQVALALMLLVGATLMTRSLARLASVEPGFTPEQVLTMRVTLPAAKYPETARWIAFHEALATQVSSIPGVTSVGLNSALPMEGGGAEAGVVVEGRPLPAPGTPAPTSLFQASTPDYHRTMGIQLLRGRFFTPQDTAASHPVVIVDDTLVSRLFPGEEALGKRIAFEFRGTRENPDIRWREIVGIVRHVRHYGLVTGPQNVQLYTPVAQLPIYFDPRRPAMAMVVRTSLNGDTAAAAIRREVAAIDRDIPIYNVQMMSRYLAQQTEQPRLSVVLLASLAGLALALALIGVYGVVAYSVAQRTAEIGVRMALGATRRDVLRLVIGRATLLILAGVVVGVGGGLALSSALRTMLYQVSERDPTTFVVGAAALTVVGLVAAVLPARRATRVDPVVALRE
jgi:putative ABC transport system permease protein